VVYRKGGEKGGKQRLDPSVAQAFHQETAKKGVEQEGGREKSNKRGLEIEV